MRCTSMICLGVVLIGVSALLAEDVPTEQGRHHVHGHHATHPNHIGLFLGVTAGGREGGDEGEATATIAFEYERRLSALIGIGFLGEFVGGERRNDAAMVALSFRPWRRPRFVIGAGWERSEAAEHSATETEPLLRLGFGYAFEVVPGNSITPEINLDFVDDETLVVAGVTIGWGF